MKKDYSEKKFSRSKQRAKILIANPGFQKRVEEIRKRFKIPSNGIKSNEESQKWHHNFYESDDIYFKTNRKRIREAIEKLKKEKKFQEGFTLNRKFNTDAPIYSFHFAIKTLLKKHKLPLSWAHSMQRYILFNNIDSMWLPGNVTVNKEFDLDTDLVKLSIGIDDSTTLDDIKKSWPMVKFHQRKLESHTKKKFQPIKKLERDKRAYELKQEGKPEREIGDIIQLEFGDTLDYNELNIAIKRYKKRININ